MLNKAIYKARNNEKQLTEVVHCHQCGHELEGKTDYRTHAGLLLGQSCLEEGCECSTPVLGSTAAQALAARAASSLVPETPAPVTASTIKETELPLFQYFREKS